MRGDEGGCNEIMRNANYNQKSDLFYNELNVRRPCMLQICTRWCALLCELLFVYIAIL